MKRIISLLLMLVLALTVVACGAKNNETPDENNTPVVNDTAEDTAENTDEVVDDTPAADAGTVGATLAAEFKAAAEADATLTAEALATTLATSATVSAINPMPMPVEEGFLTGFDNYEVKGFSEGVMFAPMIGTIPFVGYVFTVADGVDAASFASELEANCNPRWNICTAAEETVTEVVGNKVFFVMCPMSFETPDEPAADMGVGDMGIDEGIPAFDGEDTAA